MTGMPFITAPAISGFVRGTPGLSTRVVTPSSSSLSSRPNAFSTRESSSYGSDGFAFESTSRTESSRPARKFAEATPDLPAPRTSARLMRSTVRRASRPHAAGRPALRDAAARDASRGAGRTPAVRNLGSSQFQGRQRHHREHDRDDPEAHDHLGLLPPR